MTWRSSRPASSGERFALVVFRDVSDRRQQQDELARSTAQLRTALEKLLRHVTTTPLAVVEWDAELRVTGFSRRAEELFGVDRRGGHGQAHRRAPVRPGAGLAPRAAGDGGHVERRPAGERERQPEPPQGRLGPALRVVPLGRARREGRLASVLSLVLDVTARVAAEARAESLARFPEENPDPVLRLSAGGAVVWANSASRELLAQLGAGAGAVPAELAGPGLEALARGSGSGPRSGPARAPSRCTTSRSAPT